MTTLLAELDNMLQEKEQRLLLEKNNALMFLKIERIASILRDGGFALTPENLANFAFLSVKEVTDALDWMTRGAKHKALPFELNSEHQPKDTVSRVIAGLVWIESRSKSKRGSKPLPPEDTKVIGVQRVMQLTGLGRMDILNAVAEHKDAILKDIPEFRDGWVNDTKEVIQQNAKNQHPETKVKLIRQAVQEIAQGRLGMVTGEMLAKWKNGAIGLDKRQIDKLLQTSMELRDLDKYRVKGTHYQPNDADREQAYLRSLRA